MNISIKPCSLTFEFDKNTKVKSILPNGENEVTIVFETQTVNSSTREVVEKPIDSTQNDAFLKSKQLNESRCPTVDAVVEYIRSHDYICDNTEIHLHFLGVILSPRGDDSFFYYKTSDAIRKAKDKIKEEEHGEWIKTGTNRKTRFDISKFLKNEPTSEEPNLGSVDMESNDCVENNEDSVGNNENSLEKQ